MFLFSINSKINILNKWKFFRIENTYKLMRPCFLLYQSYGLLPYKINKKSIIFSKFGLCYSVAATIICIAYLVVLLYQCNVSREIKFDTVEGLMQFNCYFILGTFICICTSISCRYRLFLLKKILDVSSILSEKECQQLAGIIYIKDAISYLFLLVQMPNVLSEDAIQMYSKIFALYITIVVCLINLQYSNFVLILKSCFKNINNNLLRLKEDYKERKIFIHKSIGNQLQFSNLPLVKLRKLQQRHHEVSNVIQELNTVFTLQIIATVLMTFAEVTFGLYFFLLHSQGRKGIDLDKQIWYNYFLTSVTYHSLKIAVMVWICQETKNESLKTGIIVHDVILNSNSEQLKAEVYL